MGHVRGAPYHLMTQGKIERWHQTLKNRILLENYYLPGDLEAPDRGLCGRLQPPPLPREHQQFNPRRRLRGSCREKGSNARPSSDAACSTNGKPRNVINQRVVVSRTRPEILPKSGDRTSIARTGSFANLQTCYERLWQSPSSNDKCKQRNNQNDVDDRRLQQFLFRV